MTVFSDSWHKRWVLLLALTITLIRPSFAQNADPEAGPVPLVPPIVTEPGMAAPENAAETEKTIPPAFQIPGGPVDIADLPDARPSWVGVLGREDGGFGQTMWEGTDATLAARLLQSIPVSTTPVMRDLTRRLLLSRATTPVPREESGLSALAPDGTPIQAEDWEGGTFLDIRLKALASIAAGEDIALLAAAIPEELRDEDFEMRMLSARLAAGDVEGVCGEVSRRLGESDDIDLRKLLAVCQLLRSETGPAQLTLQLLEAELPESDPFLPAAFAAAGGAPFRVPADTGELLSGAFLVAGGGAAGGTDLSDLRMTAEWGQGRDDFRLPAAERVVAAGVLSPATLARLYSETEIDETRVRGVGDVTRTFPPVQARAYLFQAASTATTVVDRARFLRLLWDSGKKTPGLSALAGATEALTVSIPPRADLAWFSVAAAQALLAAGRYEEAEAWIAQLAASPNLDFESSGSLYELFPVLALAGRPIPEPYSVFPDGDVRAALPRAGSEQEHVRNLSRLLVVLEGVGIPVPVDSWVGLLDDGSLRTREEIPSAAVRYQLRDAVASGRVAETVLFVLVILGSEGPKEAGPLVLNAAIRSLRAIGLEEDALALALEAAI